MTTFHWSVLTATVAGGLGVGVIAMTALRRRAARRRAVLAELGRRCRRRRINVVAIDEVARPSPGRKKHQ